jgi:hypothetical protein
MHVYLFSLTKKFYRLYDCIVICHLAFEQHYLNQYILSKEAYTVILHAQLAYEMYSVEIVGTLAQSII